MAKKMTKIAAPIVALIVVVIGAYIFRLVAETSTSVSLKWVHQAQFAGLYSAKERGGYWWRGLDVNIEEFDFEKTPAEKLIANETDFALMSTDEFFIHVDTGEDLVAIAAFYQISPFSLVSLKESGIDNPADYLGKTLGNKGGKIEEELAYLILLENFGISERDVEIKTLGFAQREIDDLIDGSADVVDLYRTDQLYHFDQEGIAYTAVHHERFGVDINNDLLVTRRSLVEENPSLVRRFVRASVKGWEYALANQETAVDHTLKYVTNEAYLDRDYELFILESSGPLIQPTSTSRIGDINANQMQSTYDALRKNFFITNEQMVSSLYTTEFLPN